MKKVILTVMLFMFWAHEIYAQCSTTNATTCVCETSGSTDCDLLPDLKVGRPPLLASGTNGVIEYSQTGNGAENGRLRVSVTTPNIGHGPLEVRTTNTYICGTDTITGTAPSTCPTTGLPPKQLVKQRVYHKNGNTMSFYDRNAGSMTYHPTHGHMHVDDWGIYTLRSQSTDPNPLNWPIIGTGAKLAFCLMDYGSCSTYNGHCTDSAGNTLTNGNFPNYGLGGGGYNCSSVVQGISSGYTDIYYQYLDGMYLNIPPGTCNGTYYIVVQIDPYDYFLEEDETNNVIVVPYTLTKQAGTTPTITASGSTNICPGASIILTSTDAQSYLWSTGATTKSIIVSQAGTYTVTTDGNTPCPATSAPTTVTIQSMPVTVTPVSSDLCPGQSTTLNTTVTTPPTGTVQTNFTNNTVYNIPDNNSAGVFSPVTVSGISPTTLSSGVVVSVQANITHTYDGDLIVSLISPSGNTVLLSNRRGGSGNNFNNTIFSMSAVTTIASGTPPFAGSYIPDGNLNSFTGNANGTWQLKVADVASTDIGTINSWTLTLNNVVPVQFNYSWSSAPAGFSSGIANPVVTPVVTTLYTVNVTNLTTGCTGTGSAYVSVNPVVLTITPDTAICQGQSVILNASGATNYTWSPSTGLSGTTGSTVTASPSVTTTYTVTGTNPTGCTSQQSVTVTINDNPIVTISPLGTICNNVSPVALTGGSPSGGTWSGAGVSSGNFNPATAGVGTHILIYQYTDANGCSGSASGAITVYDCGCPPPNTPGGMTGATKICPGSTYVYSISNVATATNYNWVTPNGINIVSGQGTNSVTVEVTGLFVSGQLCVYAESACGSSAGRCKNLSKNTARTAGAISGERYGHCETTTGFSIAPTSGALSYNWMVPSGVNIASGQGTTGISVTTLPGFVSGQVCVTTNNGCMTSNPRCVTIYSAPVRPVIGGSNYTCAGQTKSYYVNPSNGATTYNWTVPSGSTIITGQGTTNVDVTFGSTAGKVKVTAINACGNKGAAVMNIDISCRSQELSPNAFEIFINPNPAVEKAEISFSENVDGPIQVQIINILGKQIYSENTSILSGTTFPLELSHVAKGIYMVTVSNRSFTKSKRLIIE